MKQSLTLEDLARIPNADLLELAGWCRWKGYDSRIGITALLHWAEEHHPDRSLALRREASSGTWLATWGGSEAGEPGGRVSGETPVDALWGAVMRLMRCEEADARVVELGHETQQAEALEKSIADLEARVAELEQAIREEMGVGL